MGGNALKDVGVIRLDADRYDKLAAQVVARLEALFPDGRIATIPHLRSKADFGDLDVLVSSFDKGPETMLADEFKPMAIVVNGPVLSFDVEVPGAVTGRFQVDLIQVAPEEFVFARSYFSYNDLGNLLGRVAHLHGFKLGHAGLFRPLRAPGNASHFVRDILVTRDWPKALAFLGYDPGRWEQGFDTMDEMFAFVAASQFFYPAAFPLEHRSHKARVRDRKRPTYTAFLQWLTERGLVPAEEMDEATRAITAAWGLAYALDQFESFQRRWVQAQADLHDDLMFRRRLNGDVVRKLTGHDGPALGQYMRALRDQFGSDEAWRAFVLKASDAELHAFLRGEACSL